jgi:Na(+)-translocating NADH:ubiquinone oxidoreductase A subunit
VSLTQVDKHIVLNDVAKLKEHADVDEQELQHIRRELGASATKRYQLLMLGAWQFMYDAHTGALPDPQGTPQAVIVSTVCLEPFMARGDAQLAARMLNFTRGLEHLQSLLEYQPIYLVLPDIQSEFADLVRNHIRGYAWVKMIEVPLVYPYDHFAILARLLGLSSKDGPVWAMRTEGVLAIDRALTLAKPCLVRIVAVGGVGVLAASHVKLMAGYPLTTVKAKHVFEPNPRVIDGGILTGQALGADALGISAECRGLTILPELTEREFFGFIRPGSDRSSYSACFLSALLKRFQERYTTGMRGEGRPCVSCNFCEEVCPAGISPHLIHKYLYRDLIEEAASARVDLCVECGLCSYVCPSKIDLRAQFVEARRVVEQEKRESAKAAAAAEEASTEENTA